jgi:hypothetical protein
MMEKCNFSNIRVHSTGLKSSNIHPTYEMSFVYNKGIFWRVVPTQCDYEDDNKVVVTFHYKFASGA